ncbi:MAG TPA: DUF2232 domain-containing protein [Coriobacteriia bacterium]|jgi:uncharacterized protein YybS (DUF2232 family)
MRWTFADMRDTVLVSLGCLVAALFALVAPVIGVPLCAMSLAYLTYRRGTLVAGVVVVAAATVVASTSPIEGLLVGVVLAAAGPYAARALRKRSPWRVAGVVAAVVFAGALGALALEAAAAHTDLVGLMQRSGAELLDMLRRSAGRSIPAEQITVMVESARQSLYQWPAWLLVESGLAGLLATYAVGWQARRAGVEDARTLPRLDELDMSWHLTWGVIAGLGLLAAARFMHQPDGPTAVLGLNVMRVTGSLLAVQGLAVFAGLYRKAGMGAVGRGIGYVFLVITEPLTAVLVPVGLVGLTGLLDLWVNLRKLPRGAEPQPAEELEEPAGED